MRDNLSESIGGLWRIRIEIFITKNAFYFYTFEHKCLIIFYLHLSTFEYEIFKLECLLIFQFKKFIFKSFISYKC